MLAETAQVNPSRRLRPFTAGACDVRRFRHRYPGFAGLHALRISTPSAHNTQPWRTKLVSGTEARIYFDPHRLLPATDPPGRQLCLSHGTLLEMMAIAASHLGYRARIEFLPEGEMTLAYYGTKTTAVLLLVEAGSNRAVPGASGDSVSSRALIGYVRYPAGAPSTAASLRYGPSSVASLCR